MRIGKERKRAKRDIFSDIFRVVRKYFIEEERKGKYRSRIHISFQ